MLPRSLGIVLFVVASALTPTAARADFQNPILGVDTTDEFFGTIRYVEPLGTFTGGEYSFMSTNWSVTVKQSRTDDFPPRRADDIEILVRHLIPPAGHGEGVGQLIQVADFLDVVPGQPVLDRSGQSDGTHFITQLHQLSSTHFDSLEVTIIPVDASTSRIFIHARHTDTRPNPIPAPPGLALAGIGIAVLLGRNRCRQAV